jgi:hypothetical protein
MCAFAEGAKMEQVEENNLKQLESQIRFISAAFGLVA